MNVSIIIIIIFLIVEYAALTHLVGNYQLKLYTK
jgi:hypothetical protein